MKLFNNFRVNHSYSKLKNLEFKKNSGLSLIFQLVFSIPPLPPIPRNGNHELEMSILCSYPICNRCARSCTQRREIEIRDARHLRVHRIFPLPSRPRSIRPVFARGHAAIAGSYARMLFRYRHSVALRQGERRSAESDDRREKARRGARAPDSWQPVAKGHEVLAPLLYAPPRRGWLP